MIKKLLTGLVIIVVAGLAYASIKRGAEQEGPAFDPQNTSYTIDGSTFTLINGELEIDVVPGSASKIVTKIFDSIKGDLNGDGKEDAALIITQNSGGTGTFFYATAAINTNTGTKGTNAILLGDRIAPQNIRITNGEIEVNYAVRKEGEPMTARPSVGVTKRFVVNGEILEAR